MPSPLAGSFLDSPRLEYSRLTVSLLNQSKQVRNFRATSVPVQSTSNISTFLIPPLPPSKMSTKHGKSSGTVMTSREYLMQLQRQSKKQNELTDRRT